MAVAERPAPPGDEGDPGAPLPPTDTPPVDESSATGAPAGDEALAQLRVEVARLRGALLRLEGERAADRARLQAYELGITDAILRLAPDGVVRSASQASGAVLGIPADALSGVLLQQRVHPDDVEAVGRAFDAAVAGGEPIRVRFRIRARDEAWRRVEAAGSVVRLPGQEPQIVLLTRRLLAAQLDTGELRADAGREPLPDVTTIGEGVFRCDPDGFFTYANPMMSRVLVGHDEGLIGRHYLEFVREDFRPQAVELYRRQQRERIPDTTFEFIARTADERELWVAQTVRLELLGTELVGFVGVVRDITLRKRMEEALRASEAELRAILTAISDVLLVLDADGRYLRVLAGRPELLARPPRELVGRTLAEVFEPDEAAALHEVIRRALATREPVAYGYRVPIDGRDAWFLATVVPLSDRTVVWAAQDRTTAVRMEQQLARGQRLEALGRMAGGIAHDFNTVLTAVSASAQLALGGLAPEHPAHADVAEIQRVALRAAHLTRQLLAFARRSSAPASGHTDAAAVLTDVQRLLARLLDARIEVTIDVPPELPPAAIDPGPLEQVLVNLALNARDAMPDGGRLCLRAHATTVRGGAVGAVGTLGTLGTLGTPAAPPLPGVGDPALGTGEPALAPGEWVVIDVEDTGAGMDERTLQQAFEPFFTTKAGDNAGLGLAVVFGLVRQVGGEVALSSAPGRGTVARVCLPAARR